MNIRNLTIEELTDEIVKIGLPKFRAKQVYEWLHKHMVNSLSESSNIGKDIQNKISDNFDLSYPVLDEEYCSKLDETKKYLIRLNDGYIIESVLMKYKFGYTVCISSQVGCDMGCKFCASTIGGCKRNLDVYELLAQIYIISKKNNVKITNIVVMGSGEPLNNFDNIVKFLKIINSEDGQNISHRNITISTCGIVPKINKLAELDFSITLALSLHAPNDTIRKTLMPIANAYTLKETMDAMANYFSKTGRRITFEYSLVKNVNDSIDNAKELCDLLMGYKNKHIDFNVNLIPVNEVKETKCENPGRIRVQNFKKILDERDINATIRRELGSDISGSCGQLRASKKI
ncbi:MAG: 23S rRNA (adenine(2503)-C(2))-methyltransferase RlmN [Methanobacteriaceae archaeon]|nr:23S rRNA (adenine(2503)-C(2))-methyltransferase RlmN [Methanobacteriaceae archaeon]